VSERDFTSEEIEALEELADLSERDPALYQSIVREGFAEAEHQAHGEALLGMFDNATERRQEQDRALLDAIFPAPEPSEGEGEGRAIWTDAAP
jgi:hypothetical protein